MPSYISTKVGPDHYPNFSATVIVNGVIYSSVDLSRMSKDAQSNAAKAALEQITGVVEQVAIPVVVPSLADAPHLYKSRLQNFALKNNMALPVYSCKREGLAHALRFKCSVTFQGRTVECSQTCSTLKEAEYAAAKLAWESWSLDDAQQDDSHLFKNLLHEFLQKKGYLVPNYEVKMSGPPHMPFFVTTIDILGKVYEGPAASSKKQSESLAAKVAYLGLKDQERKEANEINLVNQQPAETQSADSQPGSNSVSWIVKTLDLSSSALQSVIATGGDVAPRVESEANAVVPAETSEELTEERKKANELNLVYQQPAETQQADSEPALQSVIATGGDVAPRMESKANAVVPAGTSEELGDFPMVEDYIAITHEAPTSSPEFSQSGKRQSLPPDHQSETIVVLPRTPNMTCQSGASVLPFNNDSN